MFESTEAAFTTLKFTQHLLGQPTVWHTRHVSCPAKMGCLQDRINAGGTSTGKDLGVWDFVPPSDSEQLLEVCCMKVVELLRVTAVTNKGFLPVQKRGQYSSTVYFTFVSSVMPLRFHIFVFILPKA